MSFAQGVLLYSFRIWCSLLDHNIFSLWRSSLRTKLEEQTIPLFAIRVGSLNRTSIFELLLRNDSSVGSNSLQEAWWLAFSHTGLVACSFVVRTGLVSLHLHRCGTGPHYGDLAICECTVCGIARSLVADTGSGHECILLGQVVYRNAGLDF